MEWIKEVGGRTDRASVDFLDSALENPESIRVAIDEAVRLIYGRRAQMGRRPTIAHVRKLSRDASILSNEGLVTPPTRNAMLREGRRVSTNKGSTWKVIRQLQQAELEEVLPIEYISS